MSKIARSTTGFVLAVVLLLTMTVTAFAATPSFGQNTNFSDEWTDIVVVSGSVGINSDVYVQAQTTGYASLFERAPCDIKLLDKNRNTLWTSYGAVPGNGETVEFYCGPDVYIIQLRVDPQYNCSGYGKAWKK